ncbi:hypothetical protein BJ508DRAFT_330046 [Ascobolus immersus RN42]|uniref:Uncharacterized protein n=1 Tax=Ascobolus immersus RN42 TaxID=1160509 RepID=A0A3N4HUT0_ASCIM|nr:hypothetical protein BJ508DRAFT_330046 [Ascobolus immersus RN42]
MTAVLLRGQPHGELVRPDWRLDVELDLTHAVNSTLGPYRPMVDSSAIYQLGRTACQANRIELSFRPLTHSRIIALIQRSHQSRENNHAYKTVRKLVVDEECSFWANCHWYRQDGDILKGRLSALKIFGAFVDRTDPNRLKFEIDEDVDLPNLTRFLAEPDIGAWSRLLRTLTPAAYPALSGNYSTSVASSSTIVRPHSYPRSTAHRASKHGIIRYESVEDPLQSEAFPAAGRRVKLISFTPKKPIWETKQTEVAMETLEHDEPLILGWIHRADAEFMKTMLSVPGKVFVGTILEAHIGRRLDDGRRVWVGLTTFMLMEFS